MMDKAGLEVAGTWFSPADKALERALAGRMNVFLNIQTIGGSLKLNILFRRNKFMLLS